MTIDFKKLSTAKLMEMEPDLSRLSDEELRNYEFSLYALTDILFDDAKLVIEKINDVGIKRYEIRKELYSRLDIDLEVPPRTVYGIEEIHKVYKGRIQILRRSV